MQESKRLIKNTTIYALGDIIPRLLGFISFPLLTHYLTPSNYGIVNYITALTTFLMVFSFLCTNTYYLVYYYRCKDELERKKLLGNLTVFIIAFNLLILLFFVLFGDSIFKLFGSEISFYPYIIIGVLTNFFNLFSILPSALYRLLEKPMFLTIINVSRGVLTLMLTLVLVIFFNFSALGVLYAGLIVNIIYAFIFIYITRNYIVWNFNVKQLKEILAFSLPLVPGSIAYYITTMSDRILIDKYLGLSDLGIYGTAATLALILNIFSYGAYKAFEPFIFKSWGREDFLLVFEKIRNSFMFVLLIGVASLCLFSKEFFQIMSSVQFHGAYIYVPMIILGVFSASIKMLYGTVITAQGKTKINSLISVFGACLSIALNIVLLPKFGIVAAALISSLVLSLECFVLIYYTKVRLKFVKPFMAIAITTLIIVGFVYILKVNHMFLSIIIKGVVLTLTVLMISKIFSLKPLTLIAGFIKK